MTERKNTRPATSRKKKKSAGRPKTPISKAMIIDIAAHHFTEQGYNGTSLEDIARGAKLSKAALLYHFPSKEQLYLAVMDFYVMALLKLILDAAVGEGDFEQRLDVLSDVMVDFLGNNSSLARLLLRDTLDNGPFTAHQGRAMVQHSLDLTYRFLRCGIAQETLADNDIRHLVLSILGVHILYFALPDVTAPFLGQSPFLAESIAKRKAIVKQQVRQLCQLLPPDSSRKV